MLSYFRGGISNTALEEAAAAKLASLEFMVSEDGRKSGERKEEEKEEKDEKKDEKEETDEKKDAKENEEEETPPADNASEGDQMCSLNVFPECVH